MSILKGLEVYKSSVNIVLSKVISILYSRAISNFSFLFKVAIYPYINNKTITSY